VVKIKPLLSSLREKKRYILYEGANNNEVSSALREFLGTLGLARGGVRILAKTANKGVVRTNNKFLNDTRSALTLVKNLKVTKVSGVLNKVMGSLNGGLK